MINVDYYIENYGNIKCEIIVNPCNFDTHFPDLENSLSVIYLSIRSYNKNIDALLIVLSSIQNKFDFII